MSEYTPLLGEPSAPANDAAGHSQVDVQKARLWEAWYGRLQRVGLQDDACTKYSQLFVEQDVTLDMIPEFTHDMLKSMGVNSAGHRTLIMRLKPERAPHHPVAGPSIPVHPGQSVVAAIAPHTTVCYVHQTVSAVDKCERCRRPICVSCKNRRHRGRYGAYIYCTQCYEDTLCCTIL